MTISEQNSKCAHTSDDSTGNARESSDQSDAAEVRLVVGVAGSTGVAVHRPQGL